MTPAGEVERGERKRTADAASAAISGSPHDARRGAADGGKHRQAAGAYCQLGDAGRDCSGPAVLLV